MSIRNFAGNSFMTPNNMINNSSNHNNIISTQEIIEAEKERKMLKLNTLKEQIGSDLTENVKKNLKKQNIKEKKSKYTKKMEKYNEKKYADRRKRHEAQKRQKRRRLEKSAVETQAQASFEEYVQKFNLSDIIIKAKEQGFKIGFAVVNDGKWLYYGLLKNGEAHGIGVSVTTDQNTIDDQLLMYNHGDLMYQDTLYTNNLGGCMLQGNDMPECSSVVNSNICCIDETFNQQKVSENIKNTFIKTKDDKNLEAHVIGINMHGDEQGHMYDTNDLISTTINAFDEIKKNGVKSEKPSLIIKGSCFDARKGFSNKDQDDKYDMLCKKVSECTNSYTVCAYHNNNQTMHWIHSNDIFASNVDYAYDVYKNGSSIEKNISAEIMNQYMNYTLNNGTWDLPNCKEKYVNFIEGLLKQQKFEKNIIGGAVCGALGGALATIGVVAYCKNKKNGCCKKQSNSTAQSIKSNNNQNNINNNQNNIIDIFNTEPRRLKNSNDVCVYKRQDNNVAK